MKEVQKALVWWSNLDSISKAQLIKIYYPGIVDISNKQIETIYLSEEEEE